MRGIIAALAATLSLAGCAASTTESADTATTTPSAWTMAPPPSPEPATPTMAQFRSDLGPVLTDLGDGMQWIGGAMQSLDFADLRAACRSFADTIDELDALLPSPDATVTDQLGSAVENFTGMARICQGANPEMDGAKIDEMGRLRDAGGQDLTAAVDRIEQLP